MDKQMIEEMATDISHANFYATEECLATDCEDCKYKHHLNGSCKDRFRAEYLLNAGYHKMQEGAVVLTKEEHKSLIYWEGRFDELIKLATETARKETAEKFAKRLKAKLNEWLEDNEDNDGKIDFGVAQIELIGVKSLEGEVIAESLIDEICEEIIGGTDDDTSKVGK